MLKNRPPKSDRIGYREYRTKKQTIYPKPLLFSYSGGRDRKFDPADRILIVEIHTQYIAWVVNISTNV
jgi:hypothetical protein